MQGPTNIKKVY